MNRRFMTPILAILLLLPISGIGRIIRVPDDVEWIHVAVEFVGRGDTVLVAPGNYNEAVRIRSLDFVLGSFMLTTGNPAYIDSTIIDGSGTGNSVIRADGGSAGSPLVRGFTLTGGDTEYGGGIICRDSTRPAFEDIKVMGNRSQIWGGGVYCTSGTEARFIRVRFENNTSRQGGGSSEYRAASLYESCSFVNNTAELGGGILSQLSSPIFINCEFINNTSNNAYFSYSHPQLTRVTFDNGESPTESIYLRGGKDGSETFFDRLTIYSFGEGGNTLVRIIGATGEYALPRFHLLNSIVVGNSDRLISIGDGAREVAVRIDFCDIEGGEGSVRSNGQVELDWGENNFDESPQFIDPENKDFRLDENSPCIDAGSEESGPDPDDSRADVGSIPFGGFASRVLGRVTDSRFGEPFPDAEVRIYCEEKEIYNGSADNDGYWSGVAFLPTIAWHTVDVMTRSPECRNGYATMFLASGGETMVDITLEPNPFQFSQERFEFSINLLDSILSEFRITSFSELPVIWQCEIVAADTEAVPDRSNKDGRRQIQNWPFGSLAQISPTSGELESGEEQEFVLKLLTTDSEGGRSIANGNYTGYLRFDVEDYFDVVYLPIDVEVVDPFSVDGRPEHIVNPWIKSFPQPLNSNLTVEYQLDRTGVVSFEIVDMAGRSRIRSRLGIQKPGIYRQSVDFEELPAGVYLLRIDAAGFKDVRKVICLK